MNFQDPGNDQASIRKILDLLKAPRTRRNPLPAPNLNDETRLPHGDIISTELWYAVQSTAESLGIPLSMLPSPEQLHMLVVLTAASGGQYIASGTTPEDGTILREIDRATASKVLQYAQMEKLDELSGLPPGTTWGKFLAWNRILCEVGTSGGTFIDAEKIAQERGCSVEQAVGASTNSYVEKHGDNGHTKFDTIPVGAYMDGLTCYDQSGVKMILRRVTPATFPAGPTHIVKSVAEAKQLPQLSGVKTTCPLGYTPWFLRDAQQATLDMLGDTDLWVLTPADQDQLDQTTVFGGGQVAPNDQVVAPEGAVFADDDDSGPGDPGDEDDSLDADEDDDDSDYDTGPIHVVEESPDDESKDVDDK